MPTRRDFVGFAAFPALAAPPAAGDRERWVDLLVRIAEPVLVNLAAGTLRKNMPIEGRTPEAARPNTHLEAVGRLLCGIAPWLELPFDDSREGKLRSRLAALAQRGLERAMDKSSPDTLSFRAGKQSVVDAAFLAQGILRAPKRLWDELSVETRRRLVEEFTASREYRVMYSNKLLFAAVVEALLCRAGATWDRMRIDYAVRTFDQTFYKGDGAYGDGPLFTWDYYNSFVIHPLLIDTLRAVGPHAPDWRTFEKAATARAARYAAVQERLIAPDGTYPIIGRSITYRCGAFHALAQASLLEYLLGSVSPQQVRSALWAVMTRQFNAPGTFDANGWLRIGLSGHQPSLGEDYISTGSLYLCSAALLPLGLPPAHRFWSAPAEPWTSAKIWAGADLPADRALEATAPDTAANRPRPAP